MYIEYISITEWLRSSELFLSLDEDSNGIEVPDNLYIESISINNLDDWIEIFNVIKYWGAVIPDDFFIFMDDNFYIVTKYIKNNIDLIILSILITNFKLFLERNWKNDYLTMMIKHNKNKWDIEKIFDNPRVPFEIVTLDVKSYCIKNYFFHKILYLDNINWNLLLQSFISPNMDYKYSNNIIIKSSLFDFKYFLIKLVSIMSCDTIKIPKEIFSFINLKELETLFKNIEHNNDINVLNDKYDWIIEYFPKFFQDKILNVNLRFIILFKCKYWNLFFDRYSLDLFDFNSLSKHVTSDFLIKNPTYPWNWKILIRDEFDFEHLFQYINFASLNSLDYENLTENSGLTIEFILSHSEFNWCWDIVFDRSDISFEIIERLSQIIELNEIDGWTILSFNESIDIDCIIETQNNRYLWNFSSILQRNDITFEHVKKIDPNFFLSEEFEVELLSKIENIELKFFYNIFGSRFNFHDFQYLIFIDIDFIYLHSEFDWDYSYLSGRNDLSLNYFYSNPTLGWEYYTISKRSDLSLDYVYNFRKDEKDGQDVNWDYGFLSKRIDLSIDYVYSYPDLYWDYEHLSLRDDLMLDFVLHHPNLDWNWQGIYNKILKEGRNFNELITQYPFIFSRMVSSGNFEIAFVVPSELYILHLFCFFVFSSISLS